MINMPACSTVRDIRDTYVWSRMLGLKAVAIDRDGSKSSQPLSSKKEVIEAKYAPGELVVTDDRTEELTTAEMAKWLDKIEAKFAPATPAPSAPPATTSGLVRQKMPQSCQAVRHGFRVADHKSYMHVGFYPDGGVGELFITGAKEGSTVSGLLDVVATLTSIALQYGVPLEELVEKFAFTRFEPAGFTNDPDVRMATSLADFVFRKLGMRHVPGYRETHGVMDAPGASREASAPVSLIDQRSDALAGVLKRPVESAGRVIEKEGGKKERAYQVDDVTCGNCGSIMVRAGTCFACSTCGQTSGCG